MTDPGRRGTILLGLSLLMVAGAAGEDGAPANVEWSHYGADRASTKYSPAAQIDRANVGRLAPVWSWRADDDTLGLSDLPRNTFKSTPLFVGGRLYVLSPYNLVVALDPATGVELWRYDPKAYRRGRVTHGGYGSRGLEHWSDGTTSRLVVATNTMQLLTLDPATGKPDPAFGEGGVVDLRSGLETPYENRAITINSPAIVCGDTIVVGSAVNDYGVTRKMPAGHVRGYDVRTGARRWIFHTIPQEGESGVETWENDSWRESGNTNVWSMMSCDEERGLVYLPLSTPTDDHYGGHRLGDNLYAESLVCLDAATGARRWHFQAVKHGLWDYDFPAAPNLVDITVDGRAIAAVAQVSKQGFTYVFDRVTGQPVWPIEERPVPPSRVPGERAAATQPFPTRPPPFERQGIGPDDLIDFTPAIRAEAERIVSRFVMGPLYEPPIVAGQDGKEGLIQVPSPVGGANWGGAGFDPETGLLYVPSQTRHGTVGLRVPEDPRSDLRYDRGHPQLSGPQGLPLVKPPYARVTAIDLHRGEIAWQVPLGQGPRFHPALRDLGLPPLGSYRLTSLAPGWPMVTKTLLFVAQAEVRASDQPSHERGIGYLRAFDKATGELLWETTTENAIQGAPMTYVYSGRQYIVAPTGGRTHPAELQAWALP